MTTDDPAAGALHGLERAIDTANDLIGELIHRLEDAGRPRLRVVSGGLEGTAPRDHEGLPRLRIAGTTEP